MRLTNTTKDLIKDAALKASFTEENSALADKMSEAAMALYESAFPKAVREKAASLPSGWVRKCDCLEFNIGGQIHRFEVKEPVVTPTASRGYCSTIASFDATDKIAMKAVSVAEEISDFNKRLRKVGSEISALLNSVSTSNQLSKAWPEGAKFYGKYIEAASDKSNVPAVLIRDLNEMLGIK